MSKYKKFEEYLRKQWFDAAKTVEEWPDWKKEALGLRKSKSRKRDPRKMRIERVTLTPPIEEGASTPGMDLQSVVVAEIRKLKS